MPLKIKRPKGLVAYSDDHDYNIHYIIVVGDKTQPRLHVNDGGKQYKILTNTEVALPLNKNWENPDFPMNDNIQDPNYDFYSVVICYSQANSQELMYLNFNWDTDDYKFHDIWDNIQIGPMTTLKSPLMRNSN